MSAPGIASPFIKAIKHYCKGLHVAPGAAACCAACRSIYDLDDDLSDDEAQEILYDAAEPGFSWSQCDSCGSNLGGDRHEAHGLPIDRDGSFVYDRDMIHLSICSDCLLFHANGDEPEDWQ